MRKLILAPLALVLLFFASCTSKEEFVNITNIDCQLQTSEPSIYYFVYVDCFDPISKKTWKHVPVRHKPDKDICVFAYHKRGSTVPLMGAIHFCHSDTAHGQPSYVGEITFQE